MTEALQINVGVIMTERTATLDRDLLDVAPVLPDADIDALQESARLCRMEAGLLRMQAADLLQDADALMTEAHVLQQEAHGLRMAWMTAVRARMRVMSNTGAVYV